MNRRVVKMAALALVLFGAAGTGILLMRWPSGQERRIDNAIQKYRFVTDGARIPRGLEVKDEDNAALLVPDLLRATGLATRTHTSEEQGSAFKRASDTSVYAIYAREKDVYFVATKMAAKKGWYVKRNWTEVERVVYPEFASLRRACQTLTGTAFTSGQQGNLSQASKDLTNAATLSRFLTKEPSVVGQLQAIACAAIVQRGILAIASQAGSKASELKALIETNQSIPEADFALAMRSESYIIYRTVTGKAVGADRLTGTNARIEKAGRGVWAPALAEYFGKCKLAMEMDDLAEAHYQASMAKKVGLPGVPRKLEELILIDYPRCLETALRSRMKKQMVIEGLRAMIDKRLPRPSRDWTGTGNELTDVKGTPNNWFIAARGENHKFDENGPSETEKKNPKDLFLIYREGKIFLLGR